MKDKQKSTRIANEYEEAISRFYESEQYILENFNNPDFHIEQAELVGEIFTLLDGITLSKKVGEEYAIIRKNIRISTRNFGRSKINKR
jgi:predicted nucleotidyltransferase